MLKGFFAAAAALFAIATATASADPLLGTGGALPDAPPAAPVSGGAPAGSEGASPVPTRAENLTVGGDRAVLLPNGQAAAPAGAPVVVQEIIWNANAIVGKPYRYGGGHDAVNAIVAGYDCSGTVSFPLLRTGLLQTPLDSSSFMTWKRPGPGQWISVYANASHAYMTVAGLRLDTSSQDDTSRQDGPRWRPLRRSDRGFKAVHPAGL